MGAWMSVRAAACLGVAALATGCSNTPVLQGRVISGNISFIAVVDGNDSRLSGEGAGIDGAEITARGGSARTLIGDATSRRDGSFSLKLREGVSYTRPIEVVAEADGFRQASGEMIIPPAGRKLLIILPPTGRAGAATGAK